MTSPLTTLRIETATLSSWPAITTAMDGMWLARMARGYTRRANSIACLDPADDRDAALRLGRMADLYALNSREPIFRVTPLAGPGIVAALDADGWVAEGGSHVLAMPLDHDYPELAEVRTCDGTDRNWLEAVAEMIGADRRGRDLLGIIVGLIAHRQAGLLIRDAAGNPAAAALAVDAAGIGTFFNVVVRADTRGRGLGRAIMHAALNWTRSAGCTHGALQVEAGNATAVGLYGSLGFVPAYDYHYRVRR
jgi:GNAT superfamily N-acetyltransferase